MPLYRPSELAKLQVRAKKSFSQNFLIDRNILEKITTAAEIQPGDRVVEIGPGPGALTEQLLKCGAHVLAIEKDKSLIHLLRDLQTPDHRLEIVEGDALAFPLTEIPKGCKIVANLPYQITTPLIEKFLREHDKITSLTLMVQKEVAKRMTAKPNTPEYGSLTVFLAAYSHPTYCFTVKPTSFYPAPKVHSAVVKLDLHPFPYPFSEEGFFLITRTAFGKKRKMLRSSLRELYPQVLVENALGEMGKKETARPGELSLDDFAALYQKCEGQNS